MMLSNVVLGTAIFSDDSNVFSMTLTVYEWCKFLLLKRSGNGKSRKMEHPESSVFLRAGQSQAFRYLVARPHA